MGRGLKNNSLETRQSFLPMSQMKQRGITTTQLIDSHPQLMDLPPTVIDKMFLLNNNQYKMNKQQLSLISLSATSKSI